MSNRDRRRIREATCAVAREVNDRLMQTLSDLDDEMVGSFVVLVAEGQDGYMTYFSGVNDSERITDFDLERILTETVALHTKQKEEADIKHLN